MSCERYSEELEKSITTFKTASAVHKVPVFQVLSDRCAGRWQMANPLASRKLLGFCQKRNLKCTSFSDKMARAAASDFPGMPDIYALE